MSLMRLEEMIRSGKTYYYRNQPTVLNSYNINHNEIEILVLLNGKPQKFIKEDEMKLDIFLNCFQEVPVVLDENSETTKTPNVPAVHEFGKAPAIYTETKEQFSTLSQMLMDDIIKVRTDPKYVSQAKQVCNNVSAIVNVTKLQLQLLKNG